MSSTSINLRRLRTDGGLTQAQIAARTGIPQPRLSRWEREAPAAADDALKLDALFREVLGDTAGPQAQATDANSELAAAEKAGA